MSAEVLLNQLHKVRKTGEGKWMACCCAHDDKNPSLSIKEGSDGHILIHCFAGCSPEEVLASVGMQMSDLMPERSAHYFDDQPPAPRQRETRSEEEQKNLEFRLMNYLRMIKKGHRFSPEEDKQHSRDFARLQQIKHAS